MSNLRDLFGLGKSFAIGIPGAFTPVCSKMHVPELVRDADKLRSIGFDRVACIAVNDPFVLEAWAREIDPDGKVTFISDGNLEFAEWLGVSKEANDLMLGTRSERYSMVINDGLIKKLTVEKSILDLKCTGTSNVLNTEEALPEAIPA